MNVITREKAAAMSDADLEETITAMMETGVFGDSGDDWKLADEAKRRGLMSGTLGEK